MVFEAIVVDILNKFLNQYVENLDTSQLKIGIWGGDVVLRNLIIKSTLFDKLDLPIKVIWGRLGKLVLKIPWKNLYGGQAVIDIEELIMIVVPIASVKYDPVKEEKFLQEKKQNRLRAVEEARKRDAENAASVPTTDTFFEKLTTQIIRNIQVTIRNIHIRYEDPDTIPDSPVSIGITMSNLTAKTTACEPEESVSSLTQELDSLINKIVSLEGLAVYWNSSSDILSHQDESLMRKALLNSIPRDDFKPKGYKYVLGPISASAYLRLNPKPELDGSNFAIPKIFISLNLKEIELGITRKQFRDIMKIVDDFHRLFAAAKYRKYRPVGKPVIGNTHEWWKFAYNAVMEDITRRRKESTWEYMKQHRKMCKEYSRLFKQKLLHKKLPTADSQKLESLEKVLDLFNLILLREQVYVEVERSEIRKSEVKSSAGWFSGWFSSNRMEENKEDEFVKKLESVLSVAEKKKLYKAIGYEESAPPTIYPVKFVETRIIFRLDEIKMIIQDDLANIFSVLNLSIKSVKMELQQRPNFAQKVNVAIGNFHVLGTQQNASLSPDIVTSYCTEKESLIEILFETKPLDSDADVRFFLKALPLRIIYHAETYNRVVDVFTAKIQTVTKIVANTRPSFRKITAMGLQYAIEERTTFEVKINVMSSHIIFPFGGVYHPDKEMVVVMLGEFNVATQENEQKDISVKKLLTEGTNEQEIFSTVLLASYTTFRCELKGVQILLQMSGEDWVKASSTPGPSSMRFLESTNVTVVIKKSLVTDDARIPKVIIEGKLPSLAFNFSEERFVSLAALIFSMPTKQEIIPLRKDTFSGWSLQSFSAPYESNFSHIQKDVHPKPAEYEQGLLLVCHFEMNELVVNVSKTKESAKQHTEKNEGSSHDTKKKNHTGTHQKDNTHSSSSERRSSFIRRLSYSSAQSEIVEHDVISPIEEKFLNLRIVTVELDFTIKTFENINSLKLGAIEFKQYQKKNLLPFVNTKGMHSDYYLFIVEYVRLDPSVPDFYTTRGAIENRLTLNVTPLSVVLNQEALLAQAEFVTTIQNRLELLQVQSQRWRWVDAEKGQEFTGSEVQTDKKIIAKGKRFRKKRQKKEIIDLFLVATLGEIDVLVETEGHGLAEFSLSGGDIQISTRKSFTSIDFNLQQIFLTDLNPLTIHKQIVSSLEKQTLSSSVTIYNSEYFGSEKSVDMSIEAELGGLRIVFLTLFFSRAFAFFNAFQAQFQTFKESAQVAAQRATKNVIKAFENAAQICVNVKIAAPLLVIPRQCSSEETLVIDLGFLTVKNSITELDYRVENKTTSRPIIDTMRFHLQRLQVSRCIFKNNSFVPFYEKTFLIPVTFELTIKRNLSIAWLRVIPQFEILARLGAIHVTLTHEDLNSSVQIIRENLGEEYNLAGYRSSFYKSEHRTSNKPKEHKEQYVTLHAELGQAASEESYVVIKLLFCMDSVIFDAVNEFKKEGSEESLNEAGLARFVLESISLKGTMFSDGSIHVSVLLLSCLLNDTRPGKEGRLTRLMERTVDSNVADVESDSNPVNSMVEVIYQKNGMDTFVDARVYKFTLILSMDFLKKVGEFFTVTPPNMDLLEASKKERMAQKKKDILKEERPYTFTLNVKLEKPDITVVENMDSINAEALIFHTEMVMKYRMAGTRQVVSGTLSDIELYSCCLNPAKRLHTLCQVIKPFTISIAGSTPLDQGLHIDICITEVVVIINPTTVELVLKCYEALLLDASVGENKNEVEDYSDLWDIHSFETNDYWFLKTEEGEDALKFSRSVSAVSIGKTNEQICLLAVPSILVSIEGLAKQQSTPLLLVEMGFELQCHNWSSKMSINCALTLEMQYFNKLILAWEPFIEPIESVSKDTTSVHKPWQLNCSIIFGDESDLDMFQPPKAFMSLGSPDILQITLTKTCLDVLGTVKDAYTSAMTKSIEKRAVDYPPYVIKNETGVPVELLLEQSQLKVCKATKNDYKIVKLESNSVVELQNDSPKLTVSIIRKEPKLCIKMMSHLSKKNLFEIPLGQTSKRFYTVFLGEDIKSHTWGLVSDVSIMDNTTTVILRSILKIENYFTEPVHIHALSEHDNEAVFVCTVEGTSSFSLPFTITYGSSKKLFFSVSGYTLSTEAYDWENMKKDNALSMLLQCDSRFPENKDPFFIMAIGEAEKIYIGNTTRRSVTSICYEIHLQPTLKIVNSLPVPLIICFQGSAKEKVLQPGNNIQITNAEPGVSTVALRINDYLEKEWSCKEIIPQDPPTFFIWKFVSYNGLEPESLNLGVHCTYKRETALYSIYSPYFMVNKTELLLAYKFDNSSTIFYHPGNFKLPVMFSPTSKKFFNKKTAYLRVGNSDWSNKFPVDVAGSGGIVDCEDKRSKVTYRVSVSITLTYNSLTRIVLFTPYYVLVNETNFLIQAQEYNSPSKAWLEIPERSCRPFWPQSHGKGKTIVIKPSDSSSISPTFAYENTDSCLLRLNDQHGGIFVDIHATQLGTYITFSPYEPGQAPALIINHSTRIVDLFEKGTNFNIVLYPFQKILYAWKSPVGERKLIFTSTKERHEVIRLDQDSEELVFTRDGDPIQYVTFLEGTQRVLLFSNEPTSAGIVSNMKTATSGVEVVIKLPGIGISLVNNINRLEILYITFVSSDIIWETKKPGKTSYKPMSSEEVYELENAYKKYLADCERNNSVDPMVDVNEKLKVNFQSMQMLKPHIRTIKRTFEPGVWCVFRALEDQTMIHIKINKVQIDNQLHDCIFPVVLTRVPPPKTVATKFKGDRPFVELSVVKVSKNRSKIQQYKYFKILIQEFHIKIDVGLIQQFWMYLIEHELSDEDKKVNFKKDLEFTEKPLVNHIQVISSNEKKNFYDLLHFSPLKIHFSFSLAGKIDNGTFPPALGVMIQSLGVTLTDVQDVIFKLSYFERKGAFMTNSQLVSEVSSHYYGQIIRQGYVLLLGLDVIGNPYGLIVGIGEGVEAFFYEPFQGIIQGPSDFAKGVAIGCKSLLGHTVGHTADTLKKLTETLSKGLAVLSLDKEYQIQRMENQHRQESTQASMARVGRGLVMGVFEGVTGVVKKPMDGAKQEGVPGFFKGMGKGMIGLVTRPVTGVVDFASSSLGAVKRATESTIDNKRTRPPRFFRDDKLVQPYKLYEAFGNAILYSLGKRKYGTTDKYEYHLELKEKEVVILTNKRIILAELSEIFGTWQEQMTISWRSMPERPRCHTRGVAITMPPKHEHSKKDRTDVKILLVQNEKKKKELCSKMAELFKLEKENTTLV